MAFVSELRPSGSAQESNVQMHLLSLRADRGSAETPKIEAAPHREIMMSQQEYEQREKLLAKLTGVRSELQDALRLATMLSEPMRNKLASVIVDIQDLLHELE